MNSEEDAGGPNVLHHKHLHINTQPTLQAVSFSLGFFQTGFEGRQLSLQQKNGNFSDQS